MDEQELTSLHTRINNICLEVAIQRGHNYNANGDMIGSYSEYSIDDIASIIKVKAIRMKHTCDNKVLKDSCIDVINCAIEVLRRVEE